MSVKAIYELDGKRLISQHLQYAQLAPFKSAVATSSLECAKLADENSWLSSEVLSVVKLKVKVISKIMKKVQIDYY